MVLDLLQVWLSLTGVAVALIVGVLFTAARLWNDSRAVDDEQPVGAVAD
ncbi:hypothetical protein [Geodermatophilus sabuli]|uniref:Uncharacterized protein n=1 Tax=Geodermatophilus sabuli TaxID=1564158 RepID=A0A285EDQ2_9ACTN|nr:hypothetical protein [Geodermatophilus sabuli]MBB3084678.1 hypothetical protein [Geodermatophilus sabuli]SNX97130.1 hypothetical protein SAMN06893097_10680 [Geodermatophilus sabuli]